MPARGFLLAAVLAVCLMACGPTPGQVNNSGHEPYLAGEYAVALELYRDAEDRAPESGAPYYNSANALYRTEEYEEALQDYDESLKHADDDLRSLGFFNRGNTAYQQQDYSGAVEAYKEVLRMNPDDRDAKHNLELALLQMPPQDQDEQREEEQNEQQDEQKEDRQDEEMDEREEEQDTEKEEQDQPITETQARQILELVGEAAQTLQERRGQVLVSPKPPSEYDW